MDTGNKFNARHIPEDLYRQLIQLMPIPCVDLIVLNFKGEILLLKRKNEPAKNKWWFPGGRIYFMETRREAALRKLNEECRLQGEIIKEIGTFDLIMADNTTTPSHAITTVFQINVQTDHVYIDNQSTEYKWMHPGDINKINENNFVTRTLQFWVNNEK